MKTYTLLLFAFLGFFSTSLYSQNDALEYVAGVQGTLYIYPDGNHINSRFENQPFFQSGFNYYHRLNKLIGIKTGLHLIYQRSKSKGLITIPLIDDFGLNPVIGIPLPVEPDRLLSKELLVLEVPLNLRLDLNEGNPRFFMETGLSMNMYWKARSKFIENGAKDQTKFLPYKGEQSLGVLANFNVGIRYDVNERLALLFQPFSSIDLSRVKLNFGRRYAVYYGIQMGVAQLF